MGRTHRQSGSRSRSRAGLARPEPVSLGMRALLALTPAGLCLAHLMFGASQTAPALWLTLALALGLAGALAFPQVRAGLADLRPLGTVAILFVLVLGVAAWTLTPWTPGGPHPIWAWAGVETGAATVNRSATVVAMIKLAGLACAFGLGCAHGARRVHAQATIEALLAVGAAYAGVSLLMFLTGAQVVSSGSRLTGGLVSANNGATVFALLTVIGLGVLLRRWRRTAGLDAASVVTQVATPLAAVLLFVTCLILTGSRMGVAAAALACAVLIAWDGVATRGGRLALATGAGLLGLVALLALRGADLVWTRMERLAVDAERRGAILDAHWRAFLDSPLFGSGLGTFNDINAQIMTAQNQEALAEVRALHNVYLQWLVEAGVVGATPMALLILLVIGVAILRLGRISTGRTLLRGLIAANLVVLVHGLTDYALQIPSIAAFWAFLLGLQFAFMQSRS